jgi:hypothetical protein
MQVGSEFEMPHHGILQVHILGEISSAKHFEYDHLLVHYFFELPKGWWFIYFVILLTFLT